MSDSSSNGSWLAPRAEQPWLQRYLTALRARWWLVAGCVAVAMLAAFVYVHSAPKSYQAEADLMVTPVAIDDPNLIGLPLIRDTSDPTAPMLTVAKLVTSPPVAQRVAAQLHGSASALAADVQATPVTQSQIIAVQATAATPARAAQIANAFAEQTVAQRTALLHQALAAEIPTLQSRLQSLPVAEQGSLAGQLAVLQTLAAGSDPTLSVSSQAQPTAAASSPHLSVSLAAGAAAGLVLGLLALLALQAVDPRLRDEDQLRELYRLPVLARMPRQRGGSSPIAPAELSPAAADSFRTLRAALAASEGGPGRGRSIVVTGDAPGEGKTTVALNLATTLAASGRQVILIEADLHRPSVGRTLRVHSRQHTEDVLIGEAELVDALVWMRPFGPNFELLLAHGGRQQALDRVGAAGVRSLLAEACAICDFVIVDCPPLLDAADVLPFAQHADELLLVARPGRSQIRRLLDLGELLGRRGITPTGVVLVGAENERESYYYRYRSGDEREQRPPAARARRARALWGLLERRSPAPAAAEDPPAAIDELPPAEEPLEPEPAPLEAEGEPFEQEPATALGLSANGAAAESEHETA
jgi:succinoglycan biosynthesis transport protein ExoP